jgi:hypothetical protein
MNQALQTMLTGKDNQTHDVVRWMAIAAVLVALGLEIYVVAVHKSQPFDMQTFGIGVGALFAAVGAALKLKESTEP